MPFIGRKVELKALQSFSEKDSASLIVIKGRRRIGKSRLVEEFGNSFKNAYFLTGVAPTIDVTDQTQKDEFVRQLHEQGIVIPPDIDWGNIFFNLSQHIKTGKTLIVFDEISWMGDKDPIFLGKLKIAWDRLFNWTLSIFLPHPPREHSSQQGN